MMRRSNPSRTLAALTSRAVAETCPLLRHWAGLPPLPPSPEPELSPEMERLRAFFAPQPETKKEAEHG